MVIQTIQVNHEINASEGEREYYKIYYLLKSRNPHLVIDVKVYSCEEKMEVDTGASASIINMGMHHEMRCKLYKLMPINSQLKTYSGHVIKPIGKLDGELVDDNQSLNVSFIFADTKRPNLLGRDILRLLRLDWLKLFDINNVREIVTNTEKLK